MSGAPAGGAEMARDLAEAIRELLQAIEERAKQPGTGQLAMEILFEGTSVARAQRALQRWEVER